MLKHWSTRLILLRGAGILLVTLGVVHLIATPHIATLIRHSASADAAHWLTPPMLLNHVLVGVLLIPLGFLTAYAAPHAVAGEFWAQVTVRTVALSVATFPILLFALMGPRYYLNAPLFALGAALTAIVAITLLAAAFVR